MPEVPIANSPLIQGALHTAMQRSANFFSIATDSAGLIQIFNVGAERMLGYGVAEVVNRHTPAHFADPAQLRSRAQALSLELGQPVEAGFQALVARARLGSEDVFGLGCIRKDGSRLPAMVSVSALQDEAGAPIGYLLLGADHTARQQAEDERHFLDGVLQANNGELRLAKVAAEKANQAKSDFLSGMSHELRSPLNAILGFAQLIETGQPAPTPQQAESVAQILKAGWYLLELINEILDLSLIESGKLSLSPEPLSLVELLDDSRAMVEAQAQAAGIAVHFPALQGPWLIRADRTRVKQVLLNLLSNAIKYNRPAGRVDVHCNAAAGRTRISVQDSGAGLSTEMQAQLFQPFNRLGQEAGVQEGTGIGLVVSKRLVELMGGRIGVDSSPGTGSVFWFELDSASEPLHEAPLPESTSPGGDPLRPGQPRHTVLCVEDNPANLMLLQRLLARRSDVQLLCAQDGRSGVELALAQRPAVILMDINLPGISGITAMHILAEDPRTRHIPVVALSANAMPRDIERGLEAGFFRYLTKPIQVGTFMDTLDAALAQARTHADKRPDAALIGDP